MNNVALLFGTYTPEYISGKYGTEVGRFGQFYNCVLTPNACHDVSLTIRYRSRISSVDALGVGELGRPDLLILASEFEDFVRRLHAFDGFKGDPVYPEKMLAAFLYEEFRVISSQVQSSGNTAHGRLRASIWVPTFDVFHVVWLNTLSPNAKDCFDNLIVALRVYASLLDSVLATRHMAALCFTSLSDLHSGFGRCLK